MPDGGIVFQAVQGHVFAVAGNFHTAVRHLVDQHKMGVDPCTAVLQPAGNIHGAADVPGPHR